MELRPYLTFHGECQEAIDLYKKVFNADVLEIARFKDIPKDPNNSMKIDSNQENWILQCTLNFGENFIRVSDCIGELNDSESERISLAVECSVSEVKTAFNELSKEGRIGIPLQKTFFSPCHGVVFDKFGIMWNFVGSDD